MPDATGDAKPAKSTMTFFVSSTGSGAAGGNLGGLAGADAKCQALAAAVGGGDHTWRAYLSTNTRSNPAGAKVNARDRIGSGPWTNQKGVVVAPSNAALHVAGFVFRAVDILDEKGVGITDKTRRGILTGTLRTGEADPAADCVNWTSAVEPGFGAAVGRTDAETIASTTTAWNFAYVAQCSEAGVRAVESEGRIYCFAADN